MQMPNLIPKVAIQFNSTAAEPLKPGTLFHITGKPGQFAESDLAYAEVARFVNAALHARGLSAAPRANRADVVVNVEFGLVHPPPPAPRRGPRPEGTPEPAI